MRTGPAASMKADNLGGDDRDAARNVDVNSGHREVARLA
jgi:hypothetical protein